MTGDQIEQFKAEADATWAPLALLFYSLVPDTYGAYRDIPWQERPYMRDVFTQAKPEWAEQPEQATVADARAWAQIVVAPDDLHLYRRGSRAEDGLLAASWYRSLPDDAAALITAAQEADARVAQAEVERARGQERIKRQAEARAAEAERRRRAEERAAAAPQRQAVPSRRIVAP